MALIKCPECGKEISDKAKSCPNCGCPRTFCEKQEEVHDRSDKASQRRKENMYIFLGGNEFIEIENGYLTVKAPGTGKITDLITNFSLEYFHVSAGFSVGMCIYNSKKKFSTGAFDKNAKGEKLESLKRFKEIMERHGVFADRSRSSILNEKSDTDKKLEKKLLQKQSENSIQNEKNRT